MAFTIDDVVKYKEGLSDKRAKQWVRIANTTLNSAMKKGATEEDATAKAIKQANGVVNNNSDVENYALYMPIQDSYDVLLKVHQEKAYMIIPVVMMVEGVHNGSHGPMLHLMEELGKFPESWNGRPVTINHPVKEGINISAGDPEVVDSCTVGLVYNTKVENKKLRAEVWIDEDKLFVVSPTMHERITNSELVEVSIGVFTEDDEEEGTYGGEDYVGIARNHRPDHLAILTEAKGACSCEDGCGLRSNNENKEAMELQDAIKTIHSAGFGVNALQVDAEGYRERMDMVYGKLHSLNTGDVYHYLEEMYDDYLIYGKDGNNSRSLYKQSYELKGGKIEFNGEPMEVHKKVEFVTNNSLIRTKFKKEVNMSTECKPCVKEKVDALIANSEGHWTEDHRTFLETLNEEMLEKVKPVIKEVEKVVEKEVQVNVMSDEDKQAIASYKAEQKEKKDKKIAEIQVNTSAELWPTDVLAKMTNDDLDRIHKSVVKEVVDYSANGGGVRPINTNSEEVLLPRGVRSETK